LGLWYLAVLALWPALLLLQLRLRGGQVHPTALLLGGQGPRVWVAVVHADHYPYLARLRHSLWLTLEGRRASIGPLPCPHGLAVLY
jgi:hypothetical protein